MKKSLSILTFFCSFLAVSSLNAVELLVTDSNGNALNTTTNKLDLGFNPTPKTISLWMTYNSSEQATANAAGGLFSGGVILSSSNPTVAMIFPPGSNSVINPNNQWNPIQIDWDQPSNFSAVQTTFSRGTQLGLQLDNTNKILLMQYVISPGSTINPAGTDFVLTVPFTYAAFQYGSSSLQTDFNPQPSNYTFTVVPEPTTYVLGAVASGMLGGVGYYRRKKVAKKA